MLSVLLTSTAWAQNWKTLTPLPYRGTCAYFFNANEGVVGTGEYRNGLPAQIFYTSDGGATWIPSRMPPLRIIGQVSDILFTDRLNGWAGITEVAQNGGSGLYKTTDGGKSWALYYPAMFIVSIAVTSNGIYFTDRATIGNPGVYHSKDGGKTFIREAVSSSPLGLTALNANVLYASAEATPTGPHLRTVDGGATWVTTNSTYEAWTAYSNRSTGSIFFASERNAEIPATKSAIFRSRDNGVTFIPVWQGLADDLTGGIGGSGRCPTILYAQAQGVKNVAGFLRSTDDGDTWSNIGGPSTLFDTRFAVTGRGAVVYAFDRFGGVFKTTNGGDATLTPYLTPSLSIIQTAPLPSSASVCDSVDVSLQLSLNICDSLRLDRVEFPSDSLEDLQYVNASFSSAPFGNGLRKIITLRYFPKQIGLETRKVKLFFSQLDGLAEDTTVSIILKGLPYSGRVFSISGSPALNFGELSVCSGDSSREISIQNIICLPQDVESIRVAGAGFSLSSSFKPFKLGIDQSRVFLVRYRPTILGPQLGKLYVESASGVDSVALVGTGVPGSRGLKLLTSSPQSSLCDSIEFTAILKNTSCGDVELQGLSIDAPFSLLSPSGVVLKRDSSFSIPIKFAPVVAGQIVRSLRIKWKIGSEILDTMIEISATAFGGTPDLVLSAATLDFDTVSTCAEYSLDLLIESIGCADLTISSLAINGSNAFTITQQPAKQIRTGTKDTIRIRFKPTAASREMGELVLQTSAGERRVPLSGVGVLDAGKITLDVSGTPSLSLCDSGTFSVRIQNTTCDEIFFDSLKRESGDDDFTLTPKDFALTPGQSALLFGTIRPQAGGLRTARYRLSLHKSDGTIIEVLAPVNTTVNAPPPLLFSLESGQRQTAVSEQVRFRISQSSIGDPAVRKIILTLKLNTDLLTPTDFEPGASYPGLRKTLKIYRDSLVLELEINNPLVTGDLGELVLTPFLSKELSTGIELTSVEVFSTDGESVCVQASILPLGSTSFSLSPACGNNIISRSLSGPLDLRLESIIPNPTSARAALHIQVAAAYDNSGRVEVYTQNGILESTIPLKFDHYESARLVPIALKGSNGVRYIRIVTSSSVTLAKLILEK